MLRSKSFDQKIKIFGPYDARRAATPREFVGRLSPTATQSVTSPPREKSRRGTAQFRAIPVAFGSLERDWRETIPAVLRQILCGLFGRYGMKVFPCYGPKNTEIFAKNTENSPPRSRRAMESTCWDVTQAGTSRKTGTANGVLQNAARAQSRWWNKCDRFGVSGPTGS